MASVQIRVQEDLADKIENAKWEIKYKLRVEVIDVDIINALIYHHLKNSVILIACIVNLKVQKLLIKWIHFQALMKS